MVRRRFIAGNRSLWTAPVEGGESRQVLESLAGDHAYEVTDDGIYFIPGSDPTRGYSLRFLELATGKIRTIAELGKLTCANLAISPDRRWALYTQADQSGSDLVLVENFRQQVDGESRPMSDRAAGSVALTPSSPSILGFLPAYTSSSQTLWRCLDRQHPPLWEIFRCGRLSRLDEVAISSAPPSTCKIPMI